MARLEADLASGDRLVLVGGDAGIGKTRLISEALERAAQAGAVVTTGGCLPLAEKLALLPIAEALWDLGRAGDGQLLTDALKTVPAVILLHAGQVELGDVGVVGLLQVQRRRPAGSPKLSRTSRPSRS